MCLPPDNRRANEADEAFINEVLRHLEPARPKGFDAGLDELVSEVRDLMRDRHAKYGPGNIARHGLAGILVRLDDKLARINTGDMDHADEKYRDAWLDVVGYGLIALMWLDGNWPGSPSQPAT